MTALAPLQLLTAPQIAFQRNVRLDDLRKLIRENPGLRQLGVTVGANRGYREEEVEKLLTALKEKQEKRAKVAATK